MKDYNNALRIKSWAEDDRPREKLMNNGSATLSDAELIAILIGSGTRRKTALDLSKEVLRSVDHNIGQLARLNVSELTQFDGIGPAKAVSIVTALELGKRRSRSQAPDRVQIKSSTDVFAVMQAVLGDLPHEEFWVLFLNASNRVVKKICISRGGMTGTIADQRIIFREALLHKSTSIILCHNHPSGAVLPSDADRGLTRKVVDAGMLMDIKVLDHLIITEHEYYSFADEGLM